MQSAITDVAKTREKARAAKEERLEKHTTHQPGKEPEKEGRDTLE
jgi:hypothetical protein